MVRVRTVVAGTVCAAAVAGVVGWTALSRDDASAESLPQVNASIQEWRWAPKDPFAAQREAEEPKKPAKPKRRKRSQPVSASGGSGAASTTTRRQTRAERLPEPVPLPDPAEPGDGDDALVKAQVLKNGVALPPLEAPPEVRAIFEAGNTIARSPYKWGGGHGKWQDSGYDCSGSVSYALAAAGLVSASMPSGGYMKWGKPGKGKWLTVYTNPGHMYLVVAGVRFDTIARGQTGSRWINSMVSSSGYVARHWPGL
jgi:cell wall-associated NlpC family hydrolase